MGNKGSKIDDISQLEGDMKHMAIQANADCVKHRRGNKILDLRES